MRLPTETKGVRPEMMNLHGFEPIIKQINYKWGNYIDDMPSSTQRWLEIHPRFLIWHGSSRGFLLHLWLPRGMSEDMLLIVRPKMQLRWSTHQKLQKYTSPALPDSHRFTSIYYPLIKQHCYQTPGFSLGSDLQIVDMIYVSSLEGIYNSEDVVWFILGIPLTHGASWHHNNPYFLR